MLDHASGRLRAGMLTLPMLAPAVGRRTGSGGSLARILPRRVRARHPGPAPAPPTRSRIVTV
jgi:hypothetical protein